MTEPFSASAVFGNNNNDGWGDDWGDWGENSSQQKQSSQVQNVTGTLQQPMSTNQYFQTHPQYPPPQAQLDQNNRNFMPNPTPMGNPPMYHNYSAPVPPMQQPFQQNFAHQAPVPQQLPQQQQPPYSPQQYVQQPAASTYINQPSPPLSQPSMSTTPQLTQQTPHAFNQTISESFSNTGENWNWSIPESHSDARLKPQAADSQLHHHSFHEHYNHSYHPQNASPINFSTPGVANNTQQVQQQQPLHQQQQPAAKIQSAQITRLKNETLSPQWSIESQVSQTSSDRSIESGEIGESRSSNTFPSDDGSSGRQQQSQQVENYENVESYDQYPAPNVAPDKLDEALNSLNIKQETPSEERRSDNFRESSFPPPPPSIATNQQADGGMQSLKSSPKTPPLPPPPTDSMPPTVERPSSGQAPPPNRGPSNGPASNPFKRVGQRSHVTTPGIGISQPLVSSTNQNYFYPSPQTTQDTSNVDNVTPENQEVPDSRSENLENLEIAPSNDRNQYLQTGHLSEDGYAPSQHLSSKDPQGDDRVPPPGLSRYVPGQQQPEENLQLPGQNFPEPPPGLDRMIPGTDLENTTDLNMERQADGEVSDSALNTNNRTSFGLTPLNHADPHHHVLHQEEISDRNLYLVPGESDTHNTQQRVIPGVEDDRPMQNTGSMFASVQPPVDIPITEQQRELCMDGENPHDPPQTVLSEISRNEPIEGGNTLDHPSNSIGSAAVTLTEVDSNLTIDSSRKDPSNNTSTADESDKDRSMFYGKNKSSRRDEDPLRRSNKSKSSRDRYDTEDSDYSDRERRRREREGSSGVDGQHRERRRDDREKDSRERKKDGRDRDRERDRERGRDRDYEYRDRDRNRYDRDRDRYGRSGRYDRDTRYETDGSKYETERSTRYDKDGDGSKRYISREEYYRKREERGGDDRRYRKEKDRERGDRYRDDRKKDERYRDGDKRRDRHDRRYEYEDYRTGSRNGTDRDRDRLRDSRERDDRKERERKYPQSAYGAQYGASGYYDPYTYYTQHQQYYEQLRRTNPQAYAEWYRTYFSQIQSVQMQRDLLTSDGRESVHSGRSSANDKDRFNRTTPFLHTSGLYNAEDYHRHLNNQSQSSAMLDQSFLSDVSGQPGSLPMYHHQQAMVAAVTFQQQQQQQRATPMVLDRSYHVDSGYYQPRLDNTDGSLRQEPATMSTMEPERLTPRKFPEIHPIVSITSGLLVTAKNRLTINGTTDSVKILSLGINDPTRKLFHSYPGPLVKDKTHKKSVIEFCEEQLRNGPPPCYAGQSLVKSRGNSVNSLLSVGVNVSKGSFTLLWNYIILLLRQNGTFVGTDISELLMRNKVEFPFESVQASIRSTNVSGRNSSLSTSDRKPRDVDDDGRFAENTEEHVVNTTEVQSTEFDFPVLAKDKEQLNEVEITDKFRNYLIYGNISDALEWATENNLWGHALFLASKVDSRQHANVMMKFANKLALNDPLQTLYQLLSGRTPSAVSCVLDEKWGDWRPHLAMLMSNSSAKPELIKKSIMTLGDSLYNRGDLYAAHFCYLLSDVTFGRFSDVKQDQSTTVTANTAVRLILLGSSHLQRSFKEFSTNEAIMMTEIYEYARSLNEERYSIVELQYYKFLLACRMLDYGMQLKCLLYMEQIADQIMLDPYRFHGDFIRKVYILGDRLKYYDPVLEKALDESVDNTGRGNIYPKVDDPAWLQRLSGILNDYNSMHASHCVDPSMSHGAVVENSIPYGGYLVDNSDHMGHQQVNEGSQERTYDHQPDINKEFTAINQKLGQLNLQYEDFDKQTQQIPNTPNQYDHQMAAPSYDQGYDSINQSSLPDESSQQLHDNYDQQKQLPSQQQQQPHPHQSQNSYSYGFESTLTQSGMFVPSPSANNDAQQQTAGYDYWGGNSEMPKPTISMPNSVSNRQGYDDDKSNASPQHVSPNQSQQQALGKQQKLAPDQSKNKENKVPTGTQSNSGWFGGIWNKFSLKPKNQMILPDDKNPTIVWDPEKKRWVNTEGDETQEEAFKPPPKMPNINPSGTPMPLQPTPTSVAGAPTSGTFGVAPPPGGDQPSHKPLLVEESQPKAANIGEPTKVPTLQSNMFKMQRNRTLKKSYVDVFNPSGAPPSRPTESVMAPAMPAIPTPQGGFFVPAPAPASGQSEMSAEGAPQFYNPNQFAGGYQQ